MEKIFEFILLIVLALGSAILFTFAIIWKFIQALYQIAFGKTPILPAEEH